MENKPAYSLSSVDNALLLLHMLRDQERITVSAAAQELGIARSTAHRLLAMLVYRDFAVRGEDRSYTPGPALPVRGLGGGSARELRRLLAPHLEALRDRVRETVNLTVREGTRVRFLASAESTEVLHVGDRTGSVLPARLASGGKVLLAELPMPRLRELYGGAAGAQNPALGGTAVPPAEWTRLLQELNDVRSRGYAVNMEETELGVCAVGVAVHDGDGRAVAAMSIAVPASRFGPDHAQTLLPPLRDAARAAQRDLGRG